MAVSKAQALQAVRRAFSGTITRNDVLNLEPTEQVYIAVAVMLAFPDYYLSECDGNQYVRDRLSTTLAGILRDGNRMQFASQTQWVPYASVSSRARLHEVITGRDRGVPIRLTPPKELTDLVAELGTTSAITRFHQDSLAGIAAERQRRAKARGAMLW